MKKKGLIIATIVMVLVLAVSLTTATYAWFNASAAATVDNVTVSVASASNISIGVATSKSVTRSSATNYVNGTIAYTEHATDTGKGNGTFASTEDKSGLGTKVSWDWSLSSIGGVWSSNDKTAFDAANSYDATHALCNGQLNAAGTATELLGVATYNKATDMSADPAVICSVIYAPFGLRVEKDDLNYLYCDITITADSERFWGIVTSLKLEISSTNGNYSGHPFNAYNVSGTPDGLMSADTTYQSTPTATTKKVTFRFIIAKDTSSKLAFGESSDIYTFDIRMFLDGNDDNCIADATQYNATIGLKFDAIDSTAYTQLTTNDPATRVVDFTA